MKNSEQEKQYARHYKDLMFIIELQQEFISNLLSKINSFDKLIGGKDATLPNSVNAKGNRGAEAKDLD